MFLKDFYDKIGGDYNQVFNQLGDDSLIIDFLNKFFNGEEIKEFKEFLSAKKYKEAFMSVHNIKGYGLNMALTPLHKAANVLCDALRNGEPLNDITPSVAALEETFNNIKTVLSKVSF